MSKTPTKTPKPTTVKTPETVTETTQPEAATTETMPTDWRLTTIRTLEQLLDAKPSAHKINDFHRALVEARFPPWYKFSVKVSDAVSKRLLAKLRDTPNQRKRMDALLHVGGVDARSALRMLIVIAGFEALAEVLEENGRE